MSYGHRLARTRWIAGFSAFLLIATLAPPADLPAWAEPAEVPKVTAGQAPQQRTRPSPSSSVRRSYRRCWKPAANR
jgi:hypothetical protein